MGRFVIVAYTPKANHEAGLLKAVKKHLVVLEAEGLITEKPAYVMRATNGTILEVFEWKSAEAIQQAHQLSSVQALWGEFAAVCDYTKLSDISETQQMFAEFESVDL